MVVLRGLERPTARKEKELKMLLEHVAPFELALGHAAALKWQRACLQRVASDGMTTAFEETPFPI
jgi:hypothetical protein